MVDGTVALRVLGNDHRHVEDLFQRYEAAEDPADRTKIAHRAVHELADGAVNEHLEMKQTLDDIDSMTAEHDEFDGLMRTLVRATTCERRSPTASTRAGILSAEQRRALGERLERTRSMVPARPQPGAPAPPAVETVAQQPTALSDRVRNAISSCSRLNPSRYYAYDCEPWEGRCAHRQGPGRGFGDAAGARDPRRG